MNPVADIYASEELFLTMETKTKDKKIIFKKFNHLEHP